MTNEILTGIKDIVEVWGKLSWCMIPALIGIEIINELIKKLYPKFNPKTSWQSNGLILHALPSIIIGVIITGYIGSKLKNYEFPNLLIPILGIIIFALLHKKIILKK